MAGLGHTKRGAEAAMARQVWAAIGTEFFQALTKHLSDAMHANLAYVGEVHHQPFERVKALAVYRDGSPADLFDYAIAGTPAAKALADGASIHAKKVRETFPSDPMLQRTGAEAFAAKGLFDSAGHPIGIIALAWRHPPRDLGPATTMLHAFAARTSSELERKRADDKLRESEQRYHAFIAGSTDAMWRIEFEVPIPLDISEDEQIDRIYRYGYVAECNDAMARMSGARSEADLIGARFGQVLPRTGERIEDLRKVIRSGYKGESFEVQTHGAAGNRDYRLRSYLGMIGNGQLGRIWVTVRDIGELRRAEFEWQASERRFRQLLETIRLAAILTDPEGRVTFCNDFVLGLTAWSMGDVIGKDLFDVMFPEEDRPGLRAAFSEAVAGRPNLHFRTPLLKRDGTRRLLDWDTTVLRGGEGAIIGIAAIGADVTDQTALEARLHEVEKLESMGKLAGGMAHDFNNVLTIIHGYAAGLLARHFGGAQEAAVEEIVRASELGTALTRRLFAFSHGEPVQAMPQDVNDAIRENERLLRSTAGDKVHLVLDLDPSAGAVLVGRGELHQVLANLTLNARDAMPNGGRLSISTRTVEIKEQGARGMPEVPAGRYVMLTVADTGVGMTKEVRAHVFEPFFTTKVQRGTGLGLASVYGIVRRAGGHISVESEPGKGTSFCILLPMLSAGQPVPAAEAPPAGREAAGTILLVEDQAPLRALAAKALRGSGYEVIEAVSGEDALSRAEEYSGRIDLLLTDLTLPGIEGTELAARLRAARPDLKVLITSGLGQSPPGEAYLQKPFTMPHLKEKVHELLTHQGGGASPPKPGK